MDDLLTTRQAARYLGLTVAQVWYRRKHADLSPTLQIGRDHFYSMAYLDAWREQKGHLCTPRFTKQLRKP